MEMRERLFQTEQWLPAPVSGVFPFFADAANLDAITPPWLNFRIITPMPLKMHVGAFIDYKLKLRGIPVRWRTCITAWQPGHRFVDEQIVGPYRLWVHEHTFLPKEGGTLVKDSIRYAVPFDWLVHDWLVRPDIEKIFAFRSEALGKLFPA